MTTSDIIATISAIISAISLFYVIRLERKQKKVNIDIHGAVLPFRGRPKQVYVIITSLSERPVYITTLWVEILSENTWADRSKRQLFYLHLEEAIKLEPREQVTRTLDIEERDRARLREIVLKEEFINLVFCARDSADNSYSNNNSPYSYNPNIRND